MWPECASPGKNELCSFVRSLTYVEQYCLTGVFILRYLTISHPGGQLLLVTTYYGRFKKKLAVHFSYQGWPGTVLHTISPILLRQNRNPDSCEKNHRNKKNWNPKDSCRNYNTYLACGYLQFSFGEEKLVVPCKRAHFTSADNKKAEPLAYVGINTFLYL